MKKMYGCCCGVDVHKDKLSVCVRRGGKKENRDYGTTTSQLLDLSEWLIQEKCEMVAMESTGSYWKPLYNVLEVQDVPVMLVNAAHMKNVPGKKTDTLDSEWIAELLEVGLLHPSFVPDKPHRELRELLTYRKSLRDIASGQLNRVQKVLQGANVKLSSHIRDINGVSGRNLLRELLNNGAPDEERIEEMREQKLVHNVRASSRELAESLNGVLTEVQKLMLREMLDLFDHIDAKIEFLDEQIDKNLNAEEKEGVELLQTLPGVGSESATTIVGIIGVDMSQFPTPKALCSWAGLAPGNNESAGKRKSCRTPKGNKLLKTTLTVCAQAASHVKNTFFHARYRRLRSRMGGKKAIIAIARSMLTAIWHILAEGVPFEDLGPEHYETERKEHAIEKHLDALAKLGWKPPQPAPAAAR